MSGYSKMTSFVVKLLTKEGGRGTCLWNWTNHRVFYAQYRKTGNTLTRSILPHRMLEVYREASTREN